VIDSGTITIIQITKEQEEKRKKRTLPTSEDREEDIREKIMLRTIRLRSNAKKKRRKENRFTTTHNLQESI
jgi:hypothetical protein